MCAHCNLTKYCARCKLLACSYLGLPSPLRHPLKASTSCSGPNTIASCALSSLLLGPWRSKLYSTWAGCEIAGTSSSFVSMLFLLSTGPPSLPLTPGSPPFLLSTSAMVSLLASLLTSVLSRNYPCSARSSLAWSSLPGSPALALALALAPALTVPLLAVTCPECLLPCIYCWCSLGLSRC